MIFLKFFKQQDWRYALPCIVFLLAFTEHIDLGSIALIRQHSLAWLFVCATGFLVCYSFKFSRKENNLLIDQLKIVFYFLYFTFNILFYEDRDLRNSMQWPLPGFLFYLYFYTLILYYMKETGNTIRRSIWFGIVLIQSNIILGLAIWAITQKIEADKQKVVALKAKEEAIKFEKQSILLNKEAEKQREEKLLIEHQLRQYEEQNELFSNQKK